MDLTAFNRKNRDVKGLQLNKQRRFSVSLKASTAFNWKNSGVNSVQPEKKAV